MLRKVILTGIGLLFVGASRFGFNLASINALGEELTGTLNLIFSTGLLIGLPTAAFSNAATVRFMARSRGEGRNATADWIYRRLYIANAISVLTCIGLLQLFSNTAVDWLNLTPRVIVLRLSHCDCLRFYQFARHALYAGDRVGVATILEIVAGLTFFASLGLMILIGTGHQLVLCFAIGYCVFVLGASWVERQRWRVTSGPHETSPHKRLCPLACSRCWAQPPRCQSTNWPLFSPERSATSRAQPLWDSVHRPWSHCSFYRECSAPFFSRNPQS